MLGRILSLVLLSLLGLPLRAAQVPVLVKDINLGTGDGNVEGLVPLNGYVYFAATDGAQGQELWRTDGTSSGTFMIKDINSGAGGSNPRYLAVLGNTLFFTATDGASGKELWKSDGTALGTGLVKDINLGAVDGFKGEEIVACNGLVFFVADDGIHGRELWCSDGTEAGTRLVKDINLGANWGSIGELTDGANELFFVADDGEVGRELWVTDGTEAGTRLVKDIAEGLDTSGPSSLVFANGLLYFSAYDGVLGGELWRSDGTGTGTYMVKDINPGLGTSTFPDRNIIPFKSGVAFQATDGTHNLKLWISDGTASGTYMVKELNPAGLIDVQPMLAMGDTLFFFVGSQLWRTDGTESGTWEVKDRATGNSVSLIDGVLFDGATHAYFNATSATAGRELWRVDRFGNAAELVADTNPGTASFEPYDVVRVGGSIFMGGVTASAGYELFMIEGGGYFTPSGISFNGSSVGLSIEGVSGQPVLVERTTDFATWAMVGYGTVSEGRLTVVDNTLPLPTSASYRCRLGHP